MDDQRLHAGSGREEEEREEQEQYVPTSRYSLPGPDFVGTAIDGMENFRDDLHNAMDTEIIEGISR
jgi:hypothetical protein